MKPSEMTYLSNSMWQNSKKRPIYLTYDIVHVHDMLNNKFSDTVTVNFHIQHRILIFQFRHVRIVLLIPTT